MDNIIDIKGYSDVMKLFRDQICEKLISKKLNKKTYLSSYVDAKEIREAKVYWVKANQLRLLKSDNYEHVQKNVSLKFDKENIVFCYCRLENETENKHPIMLSRNYDLTKLLVLKCH